jgi:sirohydrochlorin ferrochelatase
MSIVANIISWLRAGYPEGVPAVDYMPLFALLGTHLTEDEVHAIADELTAHGDEQSVEAIHAAINAVTQETPLDGDIARVRAHLAAGGWPLADFRAAGNS